MHIQTTSGFFMHDGASEHNLNRQVFKNISHHSPERQKTINGSKLFTFRQHGSNSCAHVY